MRILAVSDIESKRYYDWYTPGVLEGFDLIVSCGDLPKEYLEFLVTMANVPLLYVPGNHDEGYASAPPEGCTCIDGRVVTVQGVRFFGLGGCHRYREGTYLYTEREMARRVRRAMPGIIRARGIDVFVTHAPARNLGDFDTVAHRGFECFHTLLDRCEPQVFVHGHIHKSYGMHIPRETMHGATRVLNAFESCVIELKESIGDE